MSEELFRPQGRTYWADAIKANGVVYESLDALVLWIYEAPNNFILDYETVIKVERSSYDTSLWITSANTDCLDGGCSCVEHGEEDNCGANGAVSETNIHWKPIEVVTVIR
jgi:hypothetical protein